MEASQCVRDLYPRLIEGDIGVLSCFADRATADSPFGGRQLPPEFVAETRAWLARHHATCSPVETIASADRVAHELILTLSLEERSVELPVLLVADVAGDDIRDLRVYHSTWPLYHRHDERHPVLPDYGFDGEPGEPVGAFLRAVAVGDAAGADVLFGSAGVMVEARGGGRSHTGSERSAWLGRVLADGGLGLRVGAVVREGERVVVEYLVDRIGASTGHAQAAALVCVTADGQLTAVRCYDDLALPD